MKRVENMEKMRESNCEEVEERMIEKREKN